MALSDFAPAQAEALVDLSAIRANVATLRAGTSAEVMAVVKADGYGHGAVPAARAALAGGASWLAVCTAAEALALRAGGIDAPLLAWLVDPADRFAELVAAGVDVSVSGPAQLAAAIAAAGTTGRTARIHLEADTGLSRGGATAADWPHLLELVAKAMADESVETVGIWSHFACADEPDHPANAAQLTAYRSALDTAAALGVRPAIRHVANSAATLSFPEAHFDLVRPGIATYGYSPILGPDGAGTSAEYGLRPAMTVRGRVLLTKRVDAGQGVSYGHAYTTDAPATLALVPLGYADGISRSAGTRGAQVWVAGRRRTISGRVSMDQFVVDIGDDAIEVGDEVVLFGPGDRGEPTADEWASALDTISYEVLTGIGNRVRRTYVGMPMSSSGKAAGR